jgi:hypothetical protein
MMLAFGVMEKSEVAHKIEDIKWLNRKEGGETEFLFASEIVKIAHPSSHGT